MKNIIIILTFVVFFFACKGKAGESVQETPAELGENASIVRNPISANSPMDTNLLARITYEESMFLFGEVKEGEVITHEFKFTNTGKVPLVINNCRSSCGCTIPEWPKEAIQPGATGVISARFNTEGKDGDQTKAVMVAANTYPRETKVYLRGKVLVKE
jgi:Protein of unknown function (DUF1573)